MRTGKIKRIGWSIGLISIVISIGSFAADSLYIDIADRIDIIVADDGSGDYTSVQEAINSLPVNNAAEKVIYIRNGVYKEKIQVPYTKPFITLIGENVDSTVLTYDDYSGRIVDNVELGTSTSYSFAADANDFRAMNLTFENSYGPGSQAVALRTNADRQVFLHCKLVGYQDTYYTWGRYRNYLKDCKIIGAIDYIFGATTAIFDSCQIHSLRESSYITAASTEEGVSFGYVFRHCRLTADNKKTGIYLGRPWKPFAKTVFFECEEGVFLHKAGWSLWSGNDNHTTCFYAEYHCFGPGSDTTDRVSWSHQLNDGQVAAYTLENIFSTTTNPGNFAHNWIPDFENDSLYQAVKKYTVKYMDSSNFNAQLTEIKYEGINLDNFSPDEYKYFIELPEGTTEIGVLEVKTDDYRATYSIKYPNDLPGISTIQVTAPDGGTYSTYSVFLSVDSAYRNALLESLKYSYVPVPDFDPEEFSYNIEFPYGTTRLPTIQAVAQVDGATLEITKPQELPGDGIIVVTSADGVNQNIYTIHFTIGPSGLEKNQAANKITLTNPFQYSLDITFNPVPAEPIEFSLFNLRGEILLYREIPAAEHCSMDSGNLAPGIYFYQFRVGSEVYTGKVVKTD
jgi:pectinesterase